MDLVTHYEGGRDPLGSILDALVAAGVSLEPPVDRAALSGADEFHLGGAVATAEVVEALGLGAADVVLDVGCGVGGPARAMAATTGCAVTGVDLTPAFVTAATHLSALTGLDHLTSFRVGDAGSLDDGADTYSAATLFHVGMNVADKAALFAEVRRVLRPGGRFAVYDIMRTGAGDPAFPVPWSSTPTTSHLADPDTYVDALSGVGFAVGDPVDRGTLVAAVLERTAATPPAVNLTHLMGPGFPEMIGNLVAALRDGTVSPVQIVATA